nr:MAG TPA: hypothetical protein [Caudoviricetes sp.]
MIVINLTAHNYPYNLQQYYIVLCLEYVII